MNTYPLIPFDATTAPAISLEVLLTDRGDALFISYKLTGDLPAVDLGDTPVHARVVKLWEKTCFELFIKNERDQYMEFNFSPVFEWNAFFFHKKGDALAEWPGIQNVKIDILHSLEVFHLIAEIKKADFPQDFFQGCEAGISAVIKERKGRLSYWALSHADQRPNFHHFDSFKYKF